MTLELIQVDVTTSEPVPNADFINVNVDAVVNIKVSRDPHQIDLAAMNFLNAVPNYIASAAKEGEGLPPIIDNVYRSSPNVAAPGVVWDPETCKGIAVVSAAGFVL